MKIIRPMDLTEAGIVDSNAPGDGYAQWQTVGRNFLTSISDLIITCNQTTLFAVDKSPSFSKTLYAFDLDTGNEVPLAFELSNFDIKSMAASPDGQYLALAGYKDGSYGFPNAEFRVYNLSTGAILTSRSVLVSDGISWGYNSAAVGFVGYTTPTMFSPVIIPAGSWGTQLDIPNVPSMLRENPTGYISAWYSFIGFVVDGNDIYYSLSSVEYYEDGGPTMMAIRKSIVGKLSTSGSNSYVVRSRAEGPSSSTAVSSPVHLTFNPVKGHVLGYLARTAEFFAFNASTLAEDTDVPTSIGAQVMSITPSLDGLEIIITNNSAQPYLRKLGSTDYTQTGSLDAEVGGFTDNIRYSAGYIVFGAPEGGYGLIDVATGSRVTQVNPTVTAGDIYTYNNHNYEALTNNNDRPDLGAVADPPTWLDLGFINPLRMLDNKLDSLTTGPSPLVINITPGALVNGLALFNVDAATVQITYTDPDDGLVYDTGQISMLDNSGVQDWYSFFFDPYLVKADLARVDLPAYIDGTVQITLDGAGADVAIGEVVLGTIYKIGDAQYGSSAGIIDFSRKEQDQFGNFEIVPRRFSKQAVFDTVIPPTYGGSVQRTLARLRATPVVWIGSVDLEETIVYGYFREFDILLSNPAFSNVTITVEGL